MRVLAHLSDLHFGRVDAAVLEPLRRRLAALAPDVVAISGDLTQRARSGQFREARAFLDTLPRPQVIVPGNHDVPLYNVFARFLRPFARYRGLIGDELEPCFVDDEIAVLGVNTARSLAFKGGRVSDRQLARTEERLRGLDSRLTRIVVMHHPVPGVENVPRVDVVLTGHLHASASTSGSPALLVQAGTATSLRTRAEANAFNLLRVMPRRIVVEHYELRGADFVSAGSETFVREGGAWKPDAGRQKAA
ncbi:MAG TPA: metallophosphoesterase [Burkholderiales bacterium]|nr:metallophosphoesterase [Burkholderiales bacterium]